MTRRRRLIIGIVGVVVLAGVATGLAVRLSGPTGSPAAVSGRLTTPQQERLEKGITAPTVTAQAGVLAKEVRSQFVNQDQPLLAPGSRLSISSPTFHALSSQMATVNATVTGPQAGRWQLVLVREAGQWLLIGTRKL
jgi:hypothetical protein